MKKWIVLFVLATFMLSGLSARGMMQEEHRVDQPYYQFMVFRLTEVLDLAPGQAEKLFPILRPYREEKQQYHNKMVTLSEEIYQKEILNKTDLEYYKKEIKQLQLKEIELDDAFYVKIETFLNPDQVVKFIFFEPRFRKELSNELRQRYQMQAKQNQKKHFWNKRK